MTSYSQIRPSQGTLPRSFAVGIDEQPRRILLKEFLELVLGRALANAEFFVIRDRMRRRRRRPRPISIGRRPDTRGPIERRLDAIEGEVHDLGVWLAEVEGGKA